MALDGDLMATQILTAMQAVGFPGIEEGDSPDTIAAKGLAYSQAVWKAIAGAIVTHIKINAVVTSSVAVTSVSGVTAGLAVSGPGTGSATGTIT